MTYINGESESPWKTPLWTFKSASFYPSAANSTFQFSIAFEIKFTTLLAIWNIFRHSIMVDFVEYDKMIKISGKVYKSDTYKKV